MPKLLGVDDILGLAAPERGERIAYGDDPLQFGDLRLPEGKNPHPVVVVIHGGCWRSQYDIEHIGSFSDALTRTGAATWTIEYRRVGNRGGGWPGTFDDVGAALAHLAQLERRYPLDLGCVVVVGHSAGGHLALWLGARAKGAPFTRPRTSTSDRRPEDDGKAQVVPKGIVSLAGVDDLRRALAEKVCDDMAAGLLGGTPDDVPERFRECSPIELLPLGLPQHLVNGALDPIVPASFGRDYAAASRASGDSTALTIIPDAGHFELIAPTTPAWHKVRTAIWEMLS